MESQPVLNLESQPVLNLESQPLGGDPAPRPAPPSSLDPIPPPSRPTPNPHPAPPHPAPPRPPQLSLRLVCKVILQVGVVLVQLCCGGILRDWVNVLKVRKPRFRDDDLSVSAPGHDSDSDDEL